MTIATLAAYQAAVRQPIQFRKGGANNTPATFTWNTLWDGAGLPTAEPAAGSLSVGNTANGLVPTDATTGAPTINFASGIGYLTAAEAVHTTYEKLMLCDRLFHAGTYSFNSNVALASQPSYASRIPAAGGYSGLRMFVETVTQFTGGTPAITVTYTNQAGAAGRSTGAFSFGAGNIATQGMMYELPLQAGDDGVQKVESVLCTTATAGTFNIVIVRPLWVGTLEKSNSADRGRLYPFDQIGMPQVFGDSCLFLMYIPFAASTNLMSVAIEIASA